MQAFFDLFDETLAKHIKSLLNQLGIQSLCDMKSKKER